MKTYPKTIFFDLFLSIFGFLIALLYRPDPSVIRSDGKGYYDYLPAVFIYNDLNFSFRQEPIEGYMPQDYQGLDIEYKNSVVNKYPCGTAILWIPTFLLAHAYCYAFGVEPNGYTLPYQYSIVISAILFLSLGLFLCKKILLMYNVSLKNILFTQVLFLFGTQLFFNTYFDSSFSHIYSFTLIAFFIYLIKKHSIEHNNKFLVYASLVLGLIVLIRPINVLIVLFLPFLFSSLNEFYSWLKHVFINKTKIILVSVFLFCSVISIQLFIWFIQTGEFVVWSYQNEGFDFLNPNIFLSLFSYQKGLFVYTPLVLLSVLLFVFTHRKKIYSIGALFFWFLILMYITSCWHMWWYGMSFGLRPLVDYFSVFLILFAIGLNKLNGLTKKLILACSFLLLGVQMIQAYQYKNFILHWDSMTKESYWKVFLKTKNRYKGLLWQVQNNTDNTFKIHSEKIDKRIEVDVSQLSNDYNTIYVAEVIPKQRLKCGKVELVYVVEGTCEDDTKIIFNMINDSLQQSVSYSDFYLFHKTFVGENTQTIKQVFNAELDNISHSRAFIEVRVNKNSCIKTINFKEINYYN